MRPLRKATAGFSALIFLIQFSTHAAATEGSELVCRRNLPALARTAELVATTQARRDELRDRYLAPDGLTSTKAFRWALKNVYYDNPSIKKVKKDFNGAQYDWAELPGGAGEWATSIYEASLKEKPNDAAKAVLDRMLEKFDDTFLRQPTNEAAAEEAVQRLAALMTETGFTQQEFMRACEQARQLREDPDLYREAHEAFATILPQYGPIWLREHHARRVLADAAWLQTRGRFYVASSVLGGVSAVVTGFMQWGGCFDGPTARTIALGIAAFPTAVNVAVPFSRAALAFVGAKARRLGASSLFRKKPKVDLAMLAEVDTLPAPLLRPDNANNWEYVFYKSQADEIAKLGAEPAPRIDESIFEFGNATHAQVQRFAMEVFDYQSFLASATEWRDLDTQAKKILETKKVTRGEAAQRLLGPIDARLSDYSAQFTDAVSLRRDSKAYVAMLDAKIAAAREVQAEALKNVPAGRDKTDHETYTLVLSERIVALERTREAVRSLGSSVERSQDALSGQVDFLRALSSGILAADSTPDANQPLDAASLKRISDLRKLVAGLKSK